MYLSEKFFFLLILNGIINLSVFSQTYQIKINKINPGPTQYPGGRGPDELVIYNPEYPNPSTGTNQYGIEITVQNGRVTSVGGNNSAIPKDGFVVSGHGQANQWIAQYSKIGATVNIIANSLKMTIDLECLGKETQAKIDKAQRIVEDATYHNKDINQDQIEKRIQDLQELSSEIELHYIKRDSLPVVHGLKKVDSIVKEILYLSAESPLIEARGVWYRPVEKNKAEIIRTLDKMEKSNLNLLFLESIWNGETIYPGKITKQKKQFKKFDPLKIFIEEGEKRGIEVHAWIHTFFVGYVGKTDSFNVGPVLKAHPDWAIIKRDGTKVSTDEDGYLYVCPAKPEVQDFLASLYREISEKYPKLGGIQLDYIRYPENSSLKESYCYCEYCRNEFKKLYNADPMEIFPDKDPELWKKWSEWRESNINLFVERIRKENDKSILSADIFPDTTISKATKMQNWLLWGKKGLLDIVAPMAYTTDPKWLGVQMVSMKKMLPKGQLIYCGLAPFLSLSAENLFEQIQTVRANSISGMIFFSLAYLSDEVLNLLKLGPFREKALLPHKYKN